MALINDPDDLNQGFLTAVTDAVFASATGDDVTITSAGSNLPTLAGGEYFEVRFHSNPVNNGLYVATGTPTAGSAACTKVSSPITPANAGSEAIQILGETGAATEKSVFFDVDNKLIWLLDQGDLSVDGVLLQTLYSFMKEEWKADDFLNPYLQPFIAITPEQFETQGDWAFVNDTSRKRIRTAGWREIDELNVLKKEYAGIITLGTFEDSVNDLAYYAYGNDPTATAAAINFTFAGPVNEAILTYELNVGPDTATGFTFTASTIVRTDGGSWITDGYKVGSQVTVIGADNALNNVTAVITSVVTATITVSGTPFTADTLDTTVRFARNYRNALSLFLRVRDADPNGKTYAQSNLASAGATSIDNKVFKFPLQNATDLKIEESDANIAANSPYTQIVVRYFDQAFAKDIDLVGTPRNFGIVIDVGTHSGVDGDTTGTGNTLTSTEGAIVDDGRYEGGTLTIHEGTNKGIYTIATGAGAITATTVQITTTFANTLSNQSFTLQRATPVVATGEEIYEKTQYLLRQAADVDATDQVVTGRTADSLLTFVGDSLRAGVSIPVNPNGGGTGVTIMGFSANDTNRLSFFDNGGTERTYPFVAAGTINFNSNLANDADGYYWMYFRYTERFTNTGFSIGSVSGASATLTSTTTSLVAELAVNDYINLSGFVEENNNGIYVCTGAPAGTGPWTAAVRKVDSETLVVEAAGPTVSLDKKPIGSPDALIVNDNGGTPIEGSTFGINFDAFDFDYDGNVQGGRTAGTDAAVLVKAEGFSIAQYVEATATIARAVGQTITLVAPLERNFSNP